MASEKYDLKSIARVYHHQADDNLFSSVRVNRHHELTEGVHISYTMLQVIPQTTAPIVNDLISKPLTFGILLRLLFKTESSESFVCIYLTRNILYYNY